MDKIRTVSREIIEQQGGLVADQIVDALKRYPNIVLEMSAEDYENFLIELLELNGEGQAFADLYFGRLTKEEQDRILEMLTREEQQMLLAHETEGGIYFPLTRENLPLLASLSAREILFSTYYFTKYPCTIWGNYGLRYPIIFDSALFCDKIKERYLAK